MRELVADVIEGEVSDAMLGGDDDVEVCALGAALVERRMAPIDLANPSLDAISCDRVADLTRHGDSESVVGVAALDILVDETLSEDPAPSSLNTKELPANA